MTLSKQIATVRQIHSFKIVAKREGWIVGQSLPEARVTQVHVADSWHYHNSLYLGRRETLAGDLNRTSGTKMEKAHAPYLVRVAKSMGIAPRYSLYGHVSGHDDHFHFDAGTWGNIGQGEFKVHAGDLCVWDTQYLLENKQDNLLGAEDTTDLNSLRLATAFHKEQFPVGKKRVQLIIDANPDGVWGPKSRAALKKWVAQWQKVLNTYGYYSGAIDGDWGPKTEASYNLFHRAY